MAKRKASEDPIEDEIRKRHRMTLVPKPVPKSSIYCPSLTNYQDIRDKLGVDTEEFRQITKSIRNIAPQMLQIDDPQCAQNKRNWASFKAAVCTNLPVFNRFEDAWPLVAYIRRWLFWRSKTGVQFKEKLKGSVLDPYYEEKSDSDGQPPNEIASSSAKQCPQMSLPPQTPVSVSDSARLSSNKGILGTPEPVGTIQRFISRPINEDELRNTSKTTLEHLREAMELEDRSFDNFKSNLQNLAFNHLDINSPFSQQTRGRLDTYKAEAFRLLPLLSSQYEGAWPLSVYTDRYLGRKNTRHKHRNTEDLEYLPHLGETDRELTVTSNVHTRTVQSCAPPALPVISPPAVFEVPSSQLSSLTPALRPAIGNSVDKNKFSPPAMPSTSDAHWITSTACSPMPATAKSASYHVRHFLSSLSPLPLDSEAIIQQFVDIGVFDEKTLKAFKICTLAQVEKLTAAITLTPLERLSLQHHFESAD